MGANDKSAATFHPFEAVLGDLPAHDDQAASAVKVGEEGQRIIKKLLPTREPEPPTILDANSIADMLCDQLQLYTEEGGNDLQGEFVDEVTFGGRIVTVDWSNGQRFQIEVTERVPGEWTDR
jgi:hypothetical protein